MDSSLTTQIGQPLFQQVDDSSDSDFQDQICSNQEEDVQIHPNSFHDQKDNEADNSSIHHFLQTSPGKVCKQSLFPANQPQVFKGNMIQQGKLNDSQKNIKEVKQHVHRSPKVKQLKYSSISIHAAYQLLRDQFADLMKKNQGYIRINPYLNHRTIQIIYYDEEKLEEIEINIEKLIDEINFMRMPKSVAESGIQFSKKYQLFLRNLNIAMFSDESNGSQSDSYFLCGKVSQAILKQKLLEITKVKFHCFCLKKYKNTRSYQAILEKIIEDKKFQQAMNLELKTKSIELAKLKRGFRNPNKLINDSILILVKYPNRVHIDYKETAAKIANYIENHYLILCFTAVPKKEKKKYYLSKENDFGWFLIQQKNSDRQLLYLFIVTRKQVFSQLKDKIIQKIKNLNIEIKGTRLFKNLPFASPHQWVTAQQKQKYKICSFPKDTPYSWTFYSPKKSIQFNWESILNDLYNC